MSQHIPDDLRQLVINRAQNRCEYCGLSQSGQAATFHIDHVFPVSAGGQTTADNLALACVGCSLHKAVRSTLSDPMTDELVPIFNPRQEDWRSHFRWDGVKVEGLTPRTVHKFHPNEFPSSTKCKSAPFSESDRITGIPNLTHSYSWFGFWLHRFFILISLI